MKNINPVRGTYDYAPIEAENREIVRQKILDRINMIKDTSDYLQYPNMARRVLESFLTFKGPSANTMMDKVLELENNRESRAVRSIMRLLNNHSHLRVIPSGDLSDDIDCITVLPDILNNLMEFIKKPELISQMGGKSREYCKNKFDVNKVNEDMCKYLNIKE